ncbi:MAG: MlaE family ABC transporter permease [Acidobacteriota bacterium]
MAGIIRGHLDDVGTFGRLAWGTARQAIRRPWGFASLLDQLYHVGVMSVSITSIVALFTGLVIALQTSYSLRNYGGQVFMGDLMALSLVRELGPVLTALMIAGRVGAGITAEIGSMAVTEQVDAIRALAANPIKKLVVPRVLATTIMLPLLVILADCIGIFGGFIIAVLEIGQTPAYYLRHVIRALTLPDIASGLIKAALFGLLISLIACHRGLVVRGGAAGVGSATTRSVVSASIMVLVSDFFITKLLLQVLG